jgi:hypothetical protein
LNKSSKLPAFFAAFLSSPRAAGFAGFDGSAARSASSRAAFSAFLAARARFFSASASALAFDLEPLDHSADSFVSDSCWAFEAFASFAAAFYSISGSIMIVYLGVASYLLGIFAKLFRHGDGDSKFRRSSQLGKTVNEVNVRKCEDDLLREQSALNLATSILDSMKP